MSQDDRHDPTPSRPNAAYDQRPYIEAAYRELNATLLHYRDLLPDSLIAMGKFALSGPQKLFSLPDPLPQVITSNVAPWPSYVLLSCRAALAPEKREAWREALPEAVAVEIAMAAADLLDEIADDDPSPFVAKFGVGQALNTGNLMLVMAQDIVRRHAEAEGRERAVQALGALQGMLVRAAVGQHLDMLYQEMDAGEVTLEMSAAMTDLKAGALMSGAARIGAIMSGANNEVVELLALIGHAIGSMAQLANDVQDVTPGSEAGGNAAESKTDLRLRKRTLPIVFALRDDAPTPNPLQRAFSSGRSESSDEEELKQAVMDAGGVQFTNLIAEVHRQQIREAVAELEHLRPGAAKVLQPLLPTE
jgi:geranylgeranyl pyrophosphate synthase